MLIITRKSLEELVDYKLTSAQVVETSATSNNSSQNYPHHDDHTIRTTDNPGFRPFTMKREITIKGLTFGEFLGLASRRGWEGFVI